MYLNKILAKKIKDSRGEPTIEVFFEGINASAPAGKSKGKHETPPYKNSLDWNIKALNNLNFNLEINSFQDLKKVELFLKDKFKLKDIKQFGANALVTLELAILKMLAKEQNKQLWQVINPKAKKLPIPVGNAIGGGLHSRNKNKPIFQEFLLIPEKKSFSQNLRTMKNNYKVLKTKVHADKKNDEGAWQTFLTNEQILQIISKLKNIRIGLDIAASSFHGYGKYHYKQKALDRKSQIRYINTIIKKYSLFYIEDPLDEEDFKGFAKINRSPTVLIVGDDLIATQIVRLNKAIKLKSINAMIIKPNQNGSFLELEKIFKLCKKHDIKTILSHRSGETLDSALADLAFGFQADFIKTGISTKWREVKLKRLAKIEKSVNSIKYSANLTKN